MKNETRRVAAVVVGVLFVVVGIAGTVAACVPQPKLVVLRPHASGPPSTKVTVDVLGLDPGPAEVRWNSVDGSLLAQGSGPDFSAPIEIPAAADGLYNVVVLSRFPSGAVGNTAVTSFLVTRAQQGQGENWGATNAAGTPQKPLSAGSSGLSTGAGIALGAAILVLGLLGGVFLTRRRLP